MSDELTPEDRKLLSEVGFKLGSVNEKLNELKTILFGEHADGFLYKFARMEPDIQSIKDLQIKVTEALKQNENLSKDLHPALEKLKRHEDYIRRQTMLRTLIIVGISTATSVAVTILTLWTTINTLIDQLKGKTP